jgi:hexosaminidase
MKVAYESWQVNLFGGLAINSPTPANPPRRVPSRHVLGSELHVWNDDPTAETDAEIARGIAPRLRVLAQKTWDTRPPAQTYAAFERLWRSIRPTGRPPSSRR